MLVICCPKVMAVPLLFSVNETLVTFTLEPPASAIGVMSTAAAAIITTTITAKISLFMWKTFLLSRSGRGDLGYRVC